MKKSAELFVYGVALSIIGYGVLFFSYMAFQSESLDRYGDTQGASAGIWTGLPLGVTGSILIACAIYRALAKIDALPLAPAAQPSADAQAG